MKMEMDREVTIRQIIKELNEPVKLTSEELLKHIKVNYGRLQQLEARIENVLVFFESGVVTEFSNGIVFALKKILGEKDNAKDS